MVPSKGGTMTREEAIIDKCTRIAQSVCDTLTDIAAIFAEHPMPAAAALAFARAVAGELRAKAIAAEPLVCDGQRVEGVVTGGRTVTVRAGDTIGRQGPGHMILGYDTYCAIRGETPDPELLAEGWMVEIRNGGAWLLGWSEDHGLFRHQDDAKETP